MSDGRKNNGGKRAGAGRKSKKEEIKLAEKMRSILSDETVLQKLADNVKNGDHKAIELWTGYLWGKPTQRVETKEIEEIPQTVFVDATSSD